MSPRLGTASIVLLLLTSTLTYSQNKNNTGSAAELNFNTNIVREIFEPDGITDHYRTKQSGYWHEPSTWESSIDNITWVNAAAAPDYTSNIISIEGGDTVYVLRSVIVDQLTVNSGAVLIINSLGADPNVVFAVRNGEEEKDMTVFGTVIATGVPPSQSPFTINPVGTLSFENGSLYEHHQNGGAIPLSLWEKGSTLKLTGTVDQRPANRSQDYSNLVIDLPDLEIHFNMTFLDNVLSGDLTIVQTKGESRFTLVGPVENELRQLTIQGNFYQYGGNFNTHGTENPNSQAVINVLGDIVVTGGNFSIARGSQGGTGTTIWNLWGNFSMSNAETLNDNPAGARFVFIGEKEHKFTLENVTFGKGGLPIEIDNTSLDIGTSVLRGEGMFAIRSGSVLKCAHNGGLDSALQNTGMTEFTTDAEYVFNGTNPQITGVKLPYAVKNLVINNSSGVTLSNDVTVNNKLDLISGNLLLNGKTVTLSSTAGITETDGYVTGTSGMITTTRVINNPQQLNIGGMGIILTSAANLETTSVEVIHSPAVINGRNSIYRTYHFAPQNNSGLNADLRLSYIESELDTMSENNLKLFNSSDGLANNWQLTDGTINTDENYIELKGVDKLMYWTLAYGDHPVSVEDEKDGIPEEFSLYQNYPNPFNPETVIKFDLPQNSSVDLSVFNIIGEKVSTIINQQMEKGQHSKVFNASAFPSGLYIYKLSAGNKVFTRKMMLVK